ncbi:type II secretion system protein [Vibrio sonorensis]|uniref:type II secretion system protein n=1 Tax=Vibrio sonorensis TaxID=1004316 RepID=UPI0008D969E3|nr:type II secretion system protein [Vibrio sonorensis]
MKNDKGFTLVELIVVILLLAIVSLYAASRYTGKGSVSAFALQDQMISVIRQVQVSRMQSNVTNLYNYCSITPSNDKQRELKALCLKSRLNLSSDCVGSSEACGLANVDGISSGVRGDDVSFSFLPNGLTQVEFDLLGNPLNAASSGVTVNISGTQSSSSLCINSQGYVSAGACL